MTKWKEQIDREIGMERKFHVDLQQQIISKANERHSKRNMPYIATLIGACCIAFLIFLTWPSGALVPKQQAQFMTVEDTIEQQSIQRFYLSGLSSDNDQFLARSSNFFHGVSRYGSKEDVQMMYTVLHEMVLSENVSGGFSKDVIVKLDNGKSLKLKLYNHGTWLGVFDAQKKLYYVAEGAAADDLRNIAFSAKFNIIQIAIFFVVITLSQLLLPKLIGYKGKFRLKFPPGVMIIFGVMIGLTMSLSGVNVVLSLWIPIIFLSVMSVYQTFLYKKQGQPRQLIQMQLFHTAMIVITWFGFSQIIMV